MVGGADTHRDTHVGAVVDSTGRLLGSAQFRTDTAGYVHLADHGTRDNKQALIA
ncbi:MAG: IS110 family transposase [Acidimicrobiia bacterium]|nr:IS110 family transposase [Acidimicrobiia bacterium]